MAGLVALPRTLLSPCADFTTALTAAPSQGKRDGATFFRPPFLGSRSETFPTVAHQAQPTVWSPSAGRTPPVMLLEETH
jgi:hypothetical protein